MFIIILTYKIANSKNKRIAQRVCCDSGRFYLHL